MTPFQKIEEGLLTSNLGLIAEAYAEITGKKIAVTPIQTGVSRQDIIREIMVKLQEEMVEPHTPQLEVEVPSGKKPKEKQKKKTKVIDDDVDLAQIPVSTVLAGPRHGLVSGPVNAKQNQLQVISYDQADTKLQKQNKNKINKNKQMMKRSPSAKVNCTNCKKPFNPERYSEGIIWEENGQETKLKCPHCSTKFNKKLSTMSLPKD